MLSAVRAAGCMKAAAPPVRDAPAYDKEPGAAFTAAPGSFVSAGAAHPPARRARFWRAEYARYFSIEICRTSRISGVCMRRK